MGFEWKSKKSHPRSAEIVVKTYYTSIKVLLTYRNLRFQPAAAREFARALIRAADEAEAAEKRYSQGQRRRAS